MTVEGADGQPSGGAGGAAPEPSPTAGSAPELSTLPPRPVVQISPGHWQGALALLDDGSVWGWGHVGRRGSKIGLAETYPGTRSAVPIPELLKVTEVGQVSARGCVLHFGGTVTCWGTVDPTIAEPSVWTGEDLGLGEMPVWQVPISSVVSLGYAFGHACALREDGTVWCWGYGNDGFLGQGVPVDSAVPVRALVPTPVVQLAIGGGVNCARDVEGSVWCWPPTYVSAQGYIDKLNDPLADCSPQQVLASGKDIVAIAAGGYDYCVLYASGSLHCAGSMTKFSAGGKQYVLESIAHLPAVKAIALGWHNACALLDGGAVQCWGGFESESGSAAFRPEDHYLPVAAGATSVAGGIRHCAIMTDGTVQCWGMTPLGDGSQDGFVNWGESMLHLEPHTVLWQKAPGSPD